MTAKTPAAARLDAPHDTNTHDLASQSDHNLQAESTASSVDSAIETTTATFHDLGISPQILQVLDRLKFTTPTPIQAQAIPVGMTGKDIIGIAQTGTGKTLAFGIPILERFVRNGNRSRGRALIVLPTRELALQVDEALQGVARGFGLRTAVLIGGAPMRPQQSALRANPDIIVATPGRLIDHMQQRMIDLRTVDVLVLDEADRMLDMGFAPQIKQILREVPEERQTMLFSATMPDDIVKIANTHMNEPVRVQVAQAGTAAENVTHEMFVVPQEGKNEILEKLLYDYTGTVLVFARTRSRASRIARHLKRLGHNSAEIHADRTLVQRRAALDGFKNGTYRVLVATDIAARGIDVSNIELVINYDLPDSPDDYVHRIGRTGRAGKTGHAIAFAAPDQAADVRDIEKLMRFSLDISKHSEHSFEPIARSAGRRAQGRRGGSTGRPSSSRPGAYSGGSNGGAAHFGGSSRGGNNRSESGRNEGERSEGGRGNEGRSDGGRERLGEQSGEGASRPAPHGLHYSNNNFAGKGAMTRGRRFNPGSGPRGGSTPR